MNAIVKVKVKREGAEWKKRLTFSALYFAILNL